MYKGSKHIIWISLSFYPITGGFGKDSGGHSLITDLLQAAKSVGNCALFSNGYGLRSPTNVTDLVPSEQRILKCSNFCKYLSEQGGISSALNQGTGTDSYRVTTYTLLRNMLGKTDSRLVQGKTRIYSLAVVGFYQKADTCSTLFPKLYALMALTI
jgi:hypothetical protein